CCPDNPTSFGMPAKNRPLRPNCPWIAEDAWPLTHRHASKFPENSEFPPSHDEIRFEFAGDVPAHFGHVALGSKLTMVPPGLSGMRGRRYGLSAALWQV